MSKTLVLTCSTKASGTFYALLRLDNNLTKTLSSLMAEFKKCYKKNEKLVYNVYNDYSPYFITSKFLDKVLRDSDPMDGLTLDADGMLILNNEIDYDECADEEQPMCLSHLYVCDNAAYWVATGEETDTEISTKLIDSKELQRLVDAMSQAQASC